MSTITSYISLVGKFTDVWLLCRETANKLLLLLLLIWPCKNLVLVSKAYLQLIHNLKMTTVVVTNKFRMSLAFTETVIKI